MDLPDFDFVVETVLARVARLDETVSGAVVSFVNGVHNGVLDGVGAAFYADVHSAATLAHVKGAVPAQDEPEFFCFRGCGRDVGAERLTCGVVCEA